ncbi:MAG TPA: carboxypeptidase regulatory-like domain-containing protein [Planctomycetes bacterium]|nr:carboxypeptidase regulatory-like domain-containing protein [Planctomycetota bacterium]HIL51903.1 carboxypeptidase regulatory-like domain-containing protein [Planctomycetota bacterium]
MKPLAVLSIVAIAIVGLFLALNILGKDTDGRGGALEQSTEVDETAIGPAPDLTSSPAAEREIAKLPTADSRSDTTPNGDGTRWNNTLSGVVMNIKQQRIGGAQITLTRAAAASRIFANEAIDRSRDVTVFADENGEYHFVNMEPYNYYMVEAEAEGYSRGAVDSITVGNTGDFEATPIQLTLGALLFGTVRDVGGNMVPGAQLILSDQYHRPGMEITPNMMLTTSDNSGYFEFQSVPTGNHTLTIEAEGYGNMSFGGLVFRGTDPVERNVILEIAEMISGRVIGKTGESVEGAEVLAMSYTNSSRACRDMVLTDSDGAFTLDSLSPGQYTLAVRAVGYRPGHESRVKTGASGLLIQLSPQATIIGRVLANGESATNFKVRLRQTYENNPATSAVGDEIAFENSDGSFMLDSVQPGTYVVQAIAEGYAPSYSDGFRVGMGMPVKGVIVHLTRGGALVGRVLNAQGKTISRPTISTHDNTWANTIFDQALGDQFPTNATSKKRTGTPDGKFKLDGLKGGAYQVRIRAPDYCELILQDILVQDGQDTDLDVVTLIKGGTVTGQVLDSTGKPIPGAKVNLRPDGRTDGLPRNYRSTTGTNGRYRIAGIYPGAYLLSAMRGGRANDFLGDLAHAQDTTQRVSVSDEQTLKFDLKVNN